MGTTPPRSLRDCSHTGAQLRTTSSGSEWLRRASASHLDLSQASGAGTHAPVRGGNSPMESYLGSSPESATLFRSYYPEEDDSVFAESPRSPLCSMRRVSSVEPGDRSHRTEAGRDPLAVSRDSVGTNWNGDPSCPGCPQERGLENWRYERDADGMSRLRQTHSADSWLRQIQYARIDLSPDPSPQPQAPAGRLPIRQSVLPADVPAKAVPLSPDAAAPPASPSILQGEIPGESIRVPSSADQPVYFRSCGSHGSFVTVSSLEDSMGCNALTPVQQGRAGSPDDYCRRGTTWCQQMPCIGRGDLRMAMDGKGGGSADQGHSFAVCEVSCFPYNALSC